MPVPMIPAPMIPTVCTASLPRLSRMPAA